MGLITATTYPLFVGLLIAGILTLAYSIVRDFLATMQIPEPEPSFDALSPEERANLEAQERAEKVRSDVMSERMRQVSVRDMLGDRFGDPKPEPELQPPKKWWQR